MRQLIKSLMEENKLLYEAYLNLRKEIYVIKYGNRKNKEMFR